MTDRLTPWSSQEASLMVPRLLSWLSVFEDTTCLRDDDLKFVVISFLNLIVRYKAIL